MENNYVLFYAENMNHLYDNIKLYNIAEFKADSYALEEMENSSQIIVIDQDEMLENTDFLTKMLPAIQFEQASKLSIDQSKSQHFPISQIKKAYHKEILVFGISPNKLGLPPHLIKHKAYQLEQYRISFTHSLNEMVQNPELKKAFWLFAKNQYLK